MAIRPIETQAPGALARSDDAERAAWAAARHRRLWRRRVLPTLGIVGLLLMWWAVVAWFGVEPFIAPSPVLVLQTLYAKRDMLLSNLIPTAIEAAGGFAIGNLAAILVATVFVHHKTLQDIFFPVVLMFNAIPIVAKAPILVLMMGNGIAPKITIAALVCFFPTLVNVVRGLESVNPQAMELMRMLSASKVEIFFRLRLFNALPHLFSALRIAASMCVIGAVVGEWVGANAGVGAMIIQATFNFDSALLYAAIVMSATLSGTFFLLVTLAERWLIRWQPEDMR
ncbi:ABC transporter permease [Verminephrobacter eiseniae]|uniref:Binding-protein-dependent transport systems inner membrane component n=1 Tax=Verminephrobacter eiseniae (strain EF01-2) TaxID=391735 RepID=A1WNL9_VEREI|nr:ABC transporter permease [Verminephrobacter eiseniae]ABM59226.1 binding-protein-dependent transport systems inner membrane component [Verminephrobacter eiseniae EF01-2]MCW5284764.1 ABC transporter permease [Verminephrobacter eiseniae]MCW5302470.1 ABC transporter permease [Verminephrobacter eiseniae]MCW8178481.1 ABC transporter permease [Verminephrobacter eiseniae]MCW8189291.1 ABC transporter permease [Verminephrobacter eiseniae]